jgi:hypothetical protein
LEDRNARSAALEVSLREVLFQIIKLVNEKKDHVPLIPKLEGAISFPYEITISGRSCILCLTISVVILHIIYFLHILISVVLNDCSALLDADCSDDVQSLKVKFVYNII